MNDAREPKSRHYTYGNVPLLGNLFAQITPPVGNITRAPTTRRPASDPLESLLNP